MSYTPTIWKSGDIVTASKLNKLEIGVSEIVPSSTCFFLNMLIPENLEEITAVETDTTAAEIYEAINNNMLPILRVSPYGDVLRLYEYVKDNNNTLNLFTFSSINNNNGDIIMLYSDNANDTLMFYPNSLPGNAIGGNYNGLLVVMANSTYDSATDSEVIDFNRTGTEVINAINNNIPVAMFDSYDNYNGVKAIDYLGIVCSMSITDDEGVFNITGGAQICYEGDPNNYLQPYSGD